jgi:hypothetical protein
LAVGPFREAWGDFHQRFPWREGQRGAGDRAGRLSAAQPGHSSRRCQLFMEFLYSKENAAEEIEEFGTPLRTDTVYPAGYKKLEDLKTIRPTIAEIIKGIPELTEKWRDTFGV